MIRKSYLAFFVGIATLTSCAEKEIKTENNAVSVKTEQVHATADYDVMPYVGVVEEQSATSVSFTGSGTITKMCVSAGQHVSKGQLIAELDKTQAKNAVAMADAMMTQANDALVRMKQLHDNNSLPDMKWVETQSKVEQARSQLEMARKQLAECSIYAPVSGVIGKDVTNVGETVLPAMPVAKILDIKNVKVKVSIPEKEIASIKSNTPMLITVDANGGKQYDGSKIEKCVEASSMTHTYDIKISVSNPEGELLPGMVCKVRKASEEAADAMVEQVTVPITAVHKNARNGLFVWVVKNNVAKRKPVSTGHATGNRIVITQGLASGDKIVTEGHQKLSEGSKVQLTVNN